MLLQKEQVPEANFHTGKVVLKSYFLIRNDGLKIEFKNFRPKPLNSGGDKPRHYNGGIRRGGVYPRQRTCIKVSF